MFLSTYFSKSFLYFQAKSKSHLRSLLQHHCYENRDISIIKQKPFGTKILKPSCQSSSRMRPWFATVLRRFSYRCINMLMKVIVYQFGSQWIAKNEIKLISSMVKHVQFVCYYVYLSRFLKNLLQFDWLCSFS